jgi:hypothetical protein
MNGQPGRPAHLRLVADMTLAQDREARERASACADLRWHWDGAYEFGHDGQQYWARRVDNGEVIGDPDLPAFRKMIRLNYHEHPVPRDPWTSGGD